MFRVGAYPRFIPEPQYEHKVRSTGIMKGTDSQLHFKAKKKVQNCNTLFL